MTTSNQRRKRRNQKQRLISRVEASLFSLEQGKQEGGNAGAVLTALCHEAHHRDEAWSVVKDAQEAGIVVDDDIKVALMATIMPHITPHGKKSVA